VNDAHLHLLLNHIPTVGFGAAVVLFAAGLMKKSGDLTQASFVAFFINALLAIPAYVSGNAAEFILRDQPGVSADVIAAHQNAAMLGFILMQMTGVVAWVALWRFQRWIVPTLLSLSVATFAFMARAATIGGGIRHPEILTGESAVSSGGAWPELAAMGTALVVNNPWVWPICEILHFVGLCLLFGAALLVNLRMLGLITGVAFSDVNRFLPWAVIGLVVNLMTGMLFFLASPDQYTQNAAFGWKMWLIVVAGATLLYPIMSEEIRALKPGAGTPLTARWMAVGSICLWVGVIFLGRFLPYIGSE
jgi:uncharacterized membrane protein